MTEMSSDERLCPECGEINPGRAKFCLECGSKLAEMDGPPPIDHGERRVVTVLFADLSGFTAYSEAVDPEAVKELASQAAGRLGDIVERYGGTVDKIIGDCVMAVFGAPVSHEDDPERAIRAALDMQDYVNEHTDRFAQLKLTIGLNTGEVVWAPVGPDGRHTVLGDTVNTAARLQSAAGRSEVYVGEPTYRAAMEAVDFEGPEPIKAKNKKEPVLAYKALRPKGSSTRRRTSRTPLVGRTAELARLTELWERVRTDRRPYLATAVGEAGIGKTRLVAALVDRVAETATVYAGRSLEYGEGITYWPMIEIVESAAGIMLSDDTPTVSAKLDAFLEQLGSEDIDELRTMAAAVSNLVGAPTTPRGTYVTTEISKGELHWGIRRVFELLAQTRPVVLVFEDLHFAEPTLIDLISSFLDTRSAAPIMILAVGRPELTAMAPDLVTARPDRRMLRLEALSETESFELLAHLVGLDMLPGGPLGDILRGAAGNPLYLEETIGMLVDEGILAEDGTLAGSLDDIRVPNTLQALIEARLDRLSAVERRTAGHAAVVGRVFWAGAVEHMEPADYEVVRGLAGLEYRELIDRNEPSTFEDELEYMFKHALIRDVSYGRLTKSQRVGLHARAAEWIAGQPGGDDDYLEIVAHHYEQACLLAQDVTRTSEPPPVINAVDYLTRAAERAEGREGTREADRFYERALTVIGGSYPETAIDLRLRRGRTAVALGRFDVAMSELEAVASSAQDLGRPDLRCRALVNLADTELNIGRIAESRAHLAEAETAAKSLDDTRHQIRTAFVRANMLAFIDGSPEAATDVLRDSVEFAEDVDDPQLLLAARLRLGTMLFNIGDLRGAETEFARSAELARERGSLLHQALATRFLCSIGFHVGPRDEAAALAQQALGWMERIGNRSTQAELLELLGLIALAEGDHDTAKDRIREALGVAPPDEAQTAVLHMHLAEVMARQGKIGQARRSAEAVRALASDEDHLTLAFAHVAEAIVAAADADEMGARAGFELAIGLLDELGQTTDLAEVRVTYGRVLAGFGDADGAAAQFQGARATYAGMGAAATIADIERELAATTEGAGRAGPLVGS